MSLFECPICGKSMGIAPNGHKCKKSTFAGIDAANTRAANADADGSDKAWHPGVAKHETLDGRLAQGFRWLAGETP